jgi:hypothetical protein
VKAARLWLQASNVQPHAPSASISDVPELHILTTQTAMWESSKLNARAAKWTAAAAVLGAVASILGAS